MRNCLKSLLIVAVFVASSFVGVKGSAAATGTASVPMTMGTANFNAGANSANFAVNTHPYVPDPALLANAVGEAQARWPGLTLDTYTFACWQFSMTANGKLIPAPVFRKWKCDNFSSGPALPDEASVVAQTVVGSLDASPPNCYPWMDASCNPAALSPGLGNMMPSLDAFVGQTVTADIVTNYCTIIAPDGSPYAGFDPITQPDGSIDYLPVASVGCVYTDWGGIQLASMGGAARLLAADTSGMTAKVSFAVKAGPTDCHVPKVKGLTLRKAKARLHRAHCGYTVRHVKGKIAGRVRYQPLAVGTGKPRGYKVKLAVVR